jgi:hypothetical protein
MGVRGVREENWKKMDGMGRSKVYKMREVRSGEKVSGK